MAKHSETPTCKRALLSREGYHHASAYQRATDHRYRNDTLAFSDCSRQISRGLPVSDADNQRNALHKAQLLVELADALHRYIEQDQHHRKQRAAARRPRGLS